MGITGGATGAVRRSRLGLGEEVFFWFLEYVSMSLGMILALGPSLGMDFVWVLNGREGFAWFCLR